MIDISSVKELQNHWRDPYIHWWYAGMPSFAQHGKEYYKQLTVHFKSKEDREHFDKLFEFGLTEKTSFVIWPAIGNEKNNKSQYKSFDKAQTKYPIYIISKNRGKYGPQTAKALHDMGVDFRVVIEPQNYDEYAESPYFSEDQILVLPFSDHGLGSGPARNWCWEHSKEEGHARHWILDDNITEFWRLHNNRRYRVNKGSACFRAMEDFVDRYENIGLASMQYKFFVADTEPYWPYMLNSRVMSCILIDNNLDIRWRGKYNEDVDLSIRALKEGYSTMVVYAFLCGKLRTGTVKGGNTDEIYGGYQDDSAYNKSKMLYEMHPECVELVERYGRAHHHLNLDRIINKKTGFSARQNVPILKPSVELKNSVDNYGMDLYRNIGTDSECIDPEFSLNVYPSGRNSIHA